MSIRISAVLTAAALFFACASPASALAVRTFVSGKGSDANACTLPLPCRTFTGAIAQTTDGGEIVVLDSAGYGAVTVTKAITISNQTGVEGAVTVNAGNAIAVNLSTPGKVTLKGLTLDGGGTGDNGINLTSTGAQTQLHIFNCTIRNFNGSGVHLAPALAMSVFITDSVFLNNHDDGLMTDAGAGVIVNVTGLRSVFSYNGQNGVELKGLGVATLIDSHLNENGLYGVIAAGSNSFLALRHSFLGLNGTKDVNFAAANATGSLYDHNYIGLYLSNGSTVTTDGSNNIAQVAGVLTPIGPQ